MKHDKDINNNVMIREGIKEICHNIIRFVKENKVDMIRATI